MLHGCPLLSLTHPNPHPHPHPLVVFFIDFMTRYVLATLYYSTFGSRWSFDLKFMQPISICSWYSVLQYVDMTTEYSGAACDQENNQIVALFLNQNNLEGTLPKEIGLLTSLKNL